MNTSRYSQNGGQTPRPRPFTSLRSHPGLLGITEAAGRCTQTPITKTLTDRKKSTFSLTINVVCVLTLPQLSRTPLVNEINLDKNRTNPMRHNLYPR
ncbi:hypothetical protein I7I50_09776 [Histoplasma capsulatum G186AR]|uniref:Uncharacterized protein n=1 Tax=Ajellomyces capsulatus TaxID=5037 RepID=A0A8H7YXJ7_AJECA|nr:hypothetical protein I7I52_10906 [Histoplasma capsulatum]QSS68716.1 hypothetical protein I7I50_09776 [Histoplasma capsulatum G186AR]